MNVDTDGPQLMDLATIRRAANLTQVQLAVGLGVGQPSVSKMDAETLLPEFATIPTRLSSTQHSPKPAAAALTT
jgi:predicted transcriptional regulator